MLSDAFAFFRLINKVTLLMTFSSFCRRLRHYLPLLPSDGRLPSLFSAAAGLRLFPAQQSRC